MSNIIENDLINAFCSGNTLSIYYKDNRPFNKNGKLIIDGTENPIIPFGSILIDSYGRLVYSTSSSLGEGIDANVYTRRILNDGTTDTTFGVNGEVITNVFGENLNDFGLSNCIDSQDRIIVAGMRQYDGPPILDILVIRYLQNGNLDPSFGTNGILNIPTINNLNVIYQVITDSNDNILITGSTGDSDQITIKILGTNGTVDTSFGPTSEGYTLLSFDIGGTYCPSTNYSIKIDSQDRILVGGSIDFPEIDGNTNFIIGRMDSNGIPDLTFNADLSGCIIIDISGSKSNDLILSIAIDSEDNYYLGGYSQNPITDETNVSIIKCLQDGTIDNTFGDNGTASLKINDGDTYANSLLIDSQNRLVVSGYTKNPIQNNNFFVARFLINGIIDTSFNNIGYVETDIITNSDDYALSMNIDSQDRIVIWGIIGTGPSYSAIVRYRESGNIDSKYRFYTEYSLDGGVSWKTIYGLSKFKADYDKNVLLLNSNNTSGFDEFNIILKTSKNELSNTYTIKNYQKILNNTIINENNIINNIASFNNLLNIANNFHNNI
jgi:uncharacterized delta-60 repeat protein